MHKEFLDFLKKFAVIGTAIGILSGQAAKSLIDSLTTNLINPFIGLFLGKVDLSSLFFEIGEAKFKYGMFLTDMINFLVVMGLIFLIVKFFINKFLSEADTSKI